MAEGSTGRLRQFWMWLVVVGCLAIGVLPILAPSTPDQGEPGTISIDRALEHVAFIAQEPHVMGTPEIDRVREYLLATLTEAGLEAEAMTVEAPDYFGNSGGTVDVVDVYTRIQGADDGDAILLMAHYDTVPTTPGANDNSTAVAALVEVGRLLAAGPPPANDVIILFTDGEEPTPRYGAWGFAEFHPWFDDVALAVNLEGVGVSGPTMLVEMSGPKGELISRLANAVPDPVAFSFMTKTAELIGGAATDFDIFRDAGIPGYNFTYLRGSSIYHTPRDAIDAVNEPGLAHHGTLALGIARDFGSLDLGDSADEAVFFTVPSGFVVRYSSTLAIASLVAALLILSAALWMRATRSGLSVREILLGFGLSLVLAGMLGVLFVATILWFGITALRPEMGMAESYAYLAVLVGLTGGSWYLVQRWSTTRGSDAAAGVLVVWLVPTLLLGAFLPAIGYLFVWPAIAMGASALFAARTRSYPARLAAVAVVALTTFVVLVPAIDTYFQFATPRPGNPSSEMPAMIVLPVFLAFLAIGAIASSATERPEGRRAGSAP